MAISTDQKLDYLYKKIGFTKSKTGLSVDDDYGATKKQGFGESIASPLVIADGSVWSQSELIPTTPPGSTTSIVRVYGIASALRLTVDPTVAERRTYIAHETFDDTTSTRLTNWIDTQYGNDYVVKVYAGDPNVSGSTLLPAGGSTGQDSWFFDYSAGVLQFHDKDIHSLIDENGANVYLVGYRYLGNTGVISPGDDTNFNDLTVNNNFKVGGISTFVGPVILNNNLNVTGVTTLAGLSTVTGHTLFTKQLNVSGVSTFAGLTTVTGHTLFTKQLNVSGISTFSDDVKIPVDNKKLIVGADNDLELFHTGGNSVIKNTSAGSLLIHGNSIDLRPTTESGEVMLRASRNAGVELRYDNEIRFETTGIGVSVLAGTGNTATIAGPQVLILDPDGVGVNTGVVRIKGDLIVDGEQTIVKSTEVEIADFVVGIATTATSDVLSDGAGFRIGPNNTFLYEYNGGISPSLKSSENLNVANGRAYQIGEVERLSASTLNVTRLLKGYSYSAAPHGGTETITVTVADKISGQHRYHGQGSSKGYVFDEQQAPFITLTPGRTYRFDQSHSSNSTHQIKFYLEADKTTLYEGGVTYNGTAGSFGAYTQIVVSDETPTILHYMCVNHGYMGNSAQVNSNVVNTNYDAILRGGLTVSGVSTFNALVDVNAELNTTGGRIVGAATSNIIPFLYNDYDDLPSAVTYHGAFGHVHSFGRAYYAHAGAWYELVNKNLDHTVGLGTESYNIGIITATGADINGDLDVDGHTELDNVNISGVTTGTTINATTFVGNGDFVDIDVDGLTNLDDVIISGVTTTSNHILPDTNGTSVDLGSSSKYFRTLYVTNLATAPGGPGIIGPDLTIRNINATGIVTVAGSTDLNGNLDVDGHTELDDVNVSGFSTFSKLVDINDGGQANTFKVEDLTDNRVVIVGSGGELEDDSNLTFDGSTLSVGVDLDVDGQTNLDHVSIAGVTTATDKIDANSDVDIAGTLDVDGHTELDNVNISGVSTFAGNIDANANLDVDGHTELDNVNVSGIITSASLRVNGESVLDGNVNMFGANYGVVWRKNTDRFQFNDNAELIFGSDNDTSIKHNNSHLLISNTTGNIDVTGNVLLNNNLDVTGPADIEGNLTVGVGGTTITTVVGAAASVGIGDASPSYMLDVAGAINSQTDVKVNGVSVTEQALNDAVAMAIALG